MAAGKERLGAAMSVVGGRKRSRYSSGMRNKKTWPPWQVNVERISAIVEGNPIWEPKSNF